MSNLDDSRVPRRLPLAAAERPGPRPSRVTRWRAAALLGVHALIAVHLVHWQMTGSTLTPLEPSEAMAFSQRGVVNAGLVFFGLAVLSTLLFGRWFCGWGCHVVALQDLSRALLKRLGITPRPLRSRALLAVPLLACAYMFVLPLLERWWRGGGLGPRAWHLTTSAFWATFPSWPVALLTFFVCGFAAVFFLGSKGFCTYACPYGALFGLADRVAPWRIRVTDACRRCGHCTSVCSSNVLVHREVHEHGMVVDPGCMKCLDCVSVCPQEALYVGRGRPALGVRSAAPPRPAYTWSEEVGLALAFLACFLAFRGVYGRVPFLLALGLGGCGALALRLGGRLLRRPQVKLLRWHLRRGGRLTPAGGLFGLGLAGFLTLGAHSGWIRYESWRADALLQDTAAIRPGWSAQLADPVRLSAPQQALVDDALAHARRVDAWGLLRDPRNDLRLAWLHLLRGEDAEAEARVRATLEALPDAASVRADYGAFLLARGRPDEALTQLRRAVALAPDVRGPRLSLLRLLVAKEQATEALQVARPLLRGEPGAEVLRLCGVASLLAGNPDHARGYLEASLRRERNPDALVALAYVLDQAGEQERAQELLAEARRLSPSQGR